MQLLQSKGAATGSLWFNSGSAICAVERDGCDECRELSWLRRIPAVEDRSSDNIMLIPAGPRPGAEPGVPDDRMKSVNYTDVWPKEERLVSS